MSRKQIASTWCKVAARSEQSIPAIAFYSFLNMGTICLYLFGSLSVLLIGSMIGCEVPELEVPENRSTETVSSSESNGAVENPTTQQPSVKQASEPVSSRRGLALTDWPDGFVYVLVKANAEETASAIAARDGSQIAKVVLGEKGDIEKTRTIVCQLEGHVWSLFAWFEPETDEFVTELSREMDTTVLKISYSEFIGWQFIDVYQGGEGVESMHWGLDYSDDLGGA